jgi:mRNA interferase MazF
VRRGDIVAAVLPGDSGKPHPALIIQGDVFGAFPMVALLPLTSTHLAGVLTRIDVEPDERNGLRVASQIVVHRVATVRRDKLGMVIGRLDDATMLAVNRALAVFLGLA